MRVRSRSSVSCSSAISRVSASCCAESAAQSAASSVRSRTCFSWCSALYWRAFSRLALDGPELAPHFLHDVPDARQVLARGLELALRLRALLLVARDPRGLLDEDAPLPRLRREHVVEALLVHERIRLGVDAGSGEEVLDVAQTAHVAVQQVLALARPIEPAGHRYLAPRDLELPVIVEDQAHLGHPDRLARGRAVEDHVLHLVAPQGLGALLPERPADGVGDIGLAAPIGADDAGHPGEDLHFGLVGEGFEAVDEYRREPHSKGRPATAAGY